MYLETMAKGAAGNTLLQLSQVMFAPSNMNKMQGIMQNPLRNLAQLHMSQIETMMASVTAAGGKPENLPTAIMMFFIERAEDPLVVLSILLGMAQKSG
jgi:hypothetical protein